MTDRFLFGPSPRECGDPEAPALVIPDSRGTGGIILSRLQEIKLPGRLGDEVVSLIRNKAPGEAVRKAVFKMHKEVGADLLDS